MITTGTRPVEADHAAEVRAAWREARRRQPGWELLPVKERLERVRRLRRLLARHAADLVAAIDHPERRSAAETLSAEILPLADACRFLERRAARLLSPRRAGGWGPLWLGGSRLEEKREPVGLVLVIGPGNYPLFLPGVQTLQALVAGNAVLWKPGVGASAAARTLLRLLGRAGFPAGLVAVLPEETEAARAAIAAGVDKVVFTGSAGTGRAVLADLAPRLTPAVLELSGCDAVFVRQDADLELAAKALVFGLELNSGATCMAPRRVFVAAERAAELEAELTRRAPGMAAVPLSADAASKVETVVRQALESGARLLAGGLPRGGRMRPLVLAGATAEMEVCAADLMAPVLALIPVAGDEEALAEAAKCPYALGAAVFSRRGGARLARRVRAGVVVVNDLIAPTADPRLSFGGRGESGSGLTRGAAGLLELTALKTVVTRRTGLRPHLRRPRPGDDSALRGLLRFLHGGPGQWRAGWLDMRRARVSSRNGNGKGSRVIGPRRSAEKGVER